MFNKKFKFSLFLTITVALTIIVVAVVISSAHLKSSEHLHTFGEWEKFKEPSCSEYGIQRRFCDCGEMQENKIDKLEHIEGEWKVDKENNEKYLYCSVCERIISTESLEDHVHSWGEWTTEIEATCTDGGLIVRSCRCGAKEEKAVSVLKHSFGEWIIVKEAKCEIEGLMERACACGKKEEKSIDPLVHVFGDWEITKEPSCEAEGLEKRFCVCGKSETRAISALSHTEGEIKLFGDKVITYCQLCGSQINTEIISASEGLKIENGVLEGIGSCSYKYVVIPQEVTEIAKKAFYKCDTIQVIVLSDGITKIGDRAFAYCDELEIVYISNSLSTLGNWPFQYSNKLTQIYYDGTVDEWNSIDKYDDWDNGMSSYTIFCTDGEIK